MIAKIKQISKWLLGITLFLALGFVYVSFGKQRPQLNTAKEMVDISIPKIAEEWNWGIFVSSSISQLIEKNDGTIETFADLSERVGNLKSYDGCRYRGSIKVRIGEKKVPGLVYKVRITGENGPAVFDVTVVKDGAIWKYAGIVIQEMPPPKPNS